MWQMGLEASRASAGINHPNFPGTQLLALVPIPGRWPWDAHTATPLLASLIRSVPWGSWTSAGARF